MGKFWVWLSDMFGWGYTWKQIRRMWSMWLMTLTSALIFCAEVLPIIWTEMPDELKGMIPENWVVFILFGLSVLGPLARPMRQGSKDL
jgi:hypothetical protein